ncbi:MAG: RNA methyltransferase substrate-binding domain-containing protein, partial [Chitinophagaceae bacterium]
MDKSYRSKSVPKKENLIVGRQPVIEAIRGARSIDKILFQQGVSGESIGEIRKLARDHQIPIQQVPVQKLNQFTRIHHQGVIA